jgi:hypothetical protein
MKTICKSLILLIIVTFAHKMSNAQSVQRHNAGMWHIEVQSMERQLEMGDTAKVLFKIRFLDTFSWHYSLNMNRQLYSYDYDLEGDSNYMASDWWAGGASLLVDTGIYYPGDSIVDSLSFYYNSENLPFSYRTLLIETINDSIQKTSQTKFIVYFTPYNTIEVWKYDDFLDLKREWDSPEDGLLADLREYILPDVGVFHQHPHPNKNDPLS